MNPASETNCFTKAAASTFTKHGKWFCDSNGRYMIFRGVNFGPRSKLFPYLPIAPLKLSNWDESEIEKEIELVRKEIGLLKKIGFNIVRLLVMWKAIEPYPNSDLDNLLPEGKRYLKMLKKIIDLLYENDQYVILDFHQDFANELFGGEGFPDWAVAINDNHKRPNPSVMRNKKWHIAYMTNKSLRFTLESFWKNSLTNHELMLKDYPVRTHLEKTIGQTINYFKLLNNGKGHPALLGIEPFNEPHRSSIGKRQFEEEYLIRFYINVNKEVRKYDDKIFLFIEPRADWTVSSRKGNQNRIEVGEPEQIKNLLNPDDISNTMIKCKINTKFINTFLPSDSDILESLIQKGVLSFHYYDTMAIAKSYLNFPENLYRMSQEWPDIFSQINDAASKRGLIPFLTEFGGLQDSAQIRQYLDLSYMQIESFLFNSTIWNFDLYCTEEKKDNWNRENYSILGPCRKFRNLDILARPYPMRSSGVPQSIFFDIETKQASIVIKGTIQDKSVPCLIYIPYEIHYSPEFFVFATSNRLEWDKQNQILYWYLESKQETNIIVISKQDSLDKDNFPERIKNLLEMDLCIQKFF
jgi:hypothetical protein